MSDVPSLFHLSATATPVAVFTRRTQKLIFLVLVANRKFLQIVETTVIDVEIHISTNARQATGISMLPKFPRAFIFHFVNIIVGYPVGIVVKDRS